MALNKDDELALLHTVIELMEKEAQLREELISALKKRNALLEARIAELASLLNAQKTVHERKRLFSDLLSPVMHTDCTNVKENGKTCTFMYMHRRMEQPRKKHETRRRKTPAFRRSIQQNPPEGTGRI